MESPQDLYSAGDIVAGKYRIERVLGRGGMAVVYAANHELLAQPIALKVIQPDSGARVDQMKRFINEARAVARLRSEHVVRVMDVGVLDDGTPYIVMERLVGMDLARAIDAEGPMPPTVAVDYVLQALVAIAEAHANGIIHRDLKPSNLFLHRPERGTEALVKVLDFGIFKSTDAFSDASSAHTATGAILGTPAYLSPEQLRSSKSVDTRTDIWSLGVILYELLSGKGPFLADTLGGVFASVLEHVPPSLARLASVPPGLARVVERCLEKDRDRRFDSVADLATALLPFAPPSGALRVSRTRELLAPLSARHAPESTAGTLVADEAHVAALSRPPPTLETAGGSWWMRSHPARSSTRSVWGFTAMAVALVAAIGFAVYERAERPARVATVAQASPAPPAPAPVAVASPTASQPPEEPPAPSAAPPPTAVATGAASSPLRSVPPRAAHHAAAPLPGLASDRQW